MILEKKDYKAFSKTEKITKFNTKYTFNVPAFGRWFMKTTYYKKGRKVKVTNYKMVGVAADSYNIVPLNATTPVLIYSLKSFYDTGILKDSKNHTIPSIITLSRPNQYNWKKMPSNFYANPLLTSAENSRMLHSGSKYTKLAAYIKQLKQINKKSDFNFYLNDYNLPLTLGQLVYETRLNPSHYKLTFITDGSATYEMFKSTYGKMKNANSMHEKLIKNFLYFRNSLRDGGHYGRRSGEYRYDNLKYGKLNKYVYAAMDAERAAGVDCQWWVIRKNTDTFDIQDTAFQKKFVDDARVSNNYINGLLTKVKEAGKEKNFKTLYKFDDSAFRKTRSRKKKIMVILGTSKKMEDQYPIFEYIKFTQAHYGKKFEYYYKGHPGYISENNPARVKQFKNLGMKILDSSIAAELFAFYNPDIHLAGYESSTFMSVGSKKTNAGIYNKVKAIAYKGSGEGALGKLDYASKIDFFMSDLSINKPDEKVKKLLNKNGHKYYLVEFNKTESDSKIAIWDANTSTATYYDLVNGVYKKVNK